VRRETPDAVSIGHRHRPHQDRIRSHLPFVRGEHRTIRRERRDHRPRIAWRQMGEIGRNAQHRIRAQRLHVTRALRQRVVEIAPRRLRQSPNAARRRDGQRFAVA